MKYNDEFRLDKFIEIMDEFKKETGIPLFDVDIEKDELKKNSTFFIYSKEGEIRPASQNHNQYLREFTLALFTADDTSIDELELAERLTKARLRFTGTEIDNGELADTNKKMKMITLRFTHVLKASDF